MKKVISSVLIIGLLMATLVGCGSKREAVVENKEVEVIGSTTVTVVAQSVADEFEKENPNIKINVQGIGSSAGVKAAHDKSADIGMASRELKEKEKEWNLTEHVIAYDGIALVTNPKNKTQLTKDQVKDIFTGKITNWSEVGGADANIIVVSREAGSGTRGAFEELTKLQEKNAEGKKVSIVKKDALVAEGNGAVKANVASKEYAIGYVSLGYVDESISVVNIDGVEPSVEAIKSGAYTISRPLLMLTNGEVSEEVKAYLDYMMSQKGQEIVAKKYIPVTK
ncbi:MAG: phosphate ABC transporter substrate-binding protein [Anaeromicrobium sp.]|jgi:phosphate transport system substrate-binding protein|uniref:phosphate ABC transporter substrate-binding protein n=1 Tax=Anaeromicrobium sp. TaxID=1929132 RepID=UPI0025F5ED4C|nr:phosphate ABC transporter substrate-binding protein [Anaeromicrobium sp.]MCT4593370.1 phosphate ABC transporter substrate-binding protein [Anaeromicrobium sp.]